MTDQGTPARRGGQAGRIARKHGSPVRCDAMPKTGPRFQANGGERADLIIPRDEALWKRDATFHNEIPDPSRQRDPEGPTPARPDFRTAGSRWGYQQNKSVPSSQRVGGSMIKDQGASRKWLTGRDRAIASPRVHGRVLPKGRGRLGRLAGPSPALELDSSLPGIGVFRNGSRGATALPRSRIGGSIGRTWVSKSNLG